MFLFFLGPTRLEKIFFINVSFSEVAGNTALSLAPSSEDEFSFEIEQTNVKTSRTVAIISLG